MPGMQQIKYAVCKNDPGALPVQCKTEFFQLRRVDDF
jgi:hypothetical protein